MLWLEMLWLEMLWLGMRSSLSRMQHWASSAGHAADLMLQGLVKHWSNTGQRACI